MSTVENYQKSKCAQISFDDGSKALVSYGATDMRILTTNLFPKTIHIFDSGFLYSLNNKIGYDMSKDVVKILADKLAEARSLEELKHLCLEIEKNKSFIDGI